MADKAAIGVCPYGARTDGSEKQTQLKSAIVHGEHSKEAATATEQKDACITTEFGVRVQDNENTLKAGARGPALLEDFHFRQKMTHFDHERIPERVVHARGTAAHGVFELTEAIPELSKAKIFNEVGMKTPTFVRFSTVMGSRGSSDTVRDVRGFATRFYTSEGNWDLVGNNIPVFFIQDSIKFPDLVHAGKPEPHNEIPQAQTAHNNFWDFNSLSPESAHMLMWVLSDRAIPKSYRMMEGFGVNTFTLIAADGSRRFVRFKWTPVLGTHGLAWDEANKLAGIDPDYHRRDLWENIHWHPHSGQAPQWRFGIQTIEEKDEHAFEFDVLDATKVWPEELIPIRYIGTMTLNKNPDEYFPEVEQVAYCTQNVVPGIGFSNDPLLQGRLFSYLDTQLLRLGGPNFHELPINRPVCPVMNNQRDGFMRHRIHPGHINYSPNRLGVPHAAPEEEGGYVHYLSRLEEMATRKKGEKFLERFNQATMFWNSLTIIEKQHVIEAARFELGRCDDTGVQDRTLTLFNHIDHGFQEAVAKGIGRPIQAKIKENHGKAAPSVSMDNPANPNIVKNSIATRRIAFLCADGVSADEVTRMTAALKMGLASPYIIAPHGGQIMTDKGTPLAVQFTYWTAKSLLFDAVYVPGGAQSISALSEIGDAQAFIGEAFKHCKAIAATGEGVELVRAVIGHLGIQFASDANSDAVVNDDAVITAKVYSAKSTLASLADAAKAVLGLEKLTDLSGVEYEFAVAIAQHRKWDRKNVTKIAC